MKLNPFEQKVLRFLVNAGHYEGEDFGYVGFASIMSATRLPRDKVRRACRSLKRRGLTKFYAGLWTENGSPAGSGYTATRAGVDFVECGAVADLSRADERARCGVEVGR